jgi:hypothetical protein
LSANLTIKFRNLAKNSAIFLAFHSYVIKSCFGKQELVLYALFPLNKVVVENTNKKIYLVLYANVLLWTPLGLYLLII